MKRCIRFLLISSIVGLVVGCATIEKRAQQYYNAGDYDATVIECVSVLKKKPTSEKAQILIQDAFRKAVDKHNSKITELNASSVKFKWDDIVSEYETLNKLNEAIKSLPPIVDKKTKANIKFEVINYSQKMASAKTNAAEVHYKEGLNLSKKEGVDIQKQAAKEFKIAEGFVSGYKDAAALYEKCKLAGIKRLAIIPFEDKSGKAGRYGAVSETIVDGIVSDVMNDPGAMEFLELISRDRMEDIMREQKMGLSGLIDEQTAVQLGKILGLHEILTGKITQIVYTPERTVDKTIKDKARVVVGRERFINNKGKEDERSVWGDVYATVTIYTRTTSASISGSYNSIDVKTAKLKKSESFIGKEYFEHVWATFSGDERALSSENKNRVARGEQAAPVEEELVSGATRNLIRSLATTLKQYAR